MRDPAPRCAAPRCALPAASRLHGTFGAASTPPPKRTRAIVELKRVAAGDKVRLDDTQSLAGLLEHILPWAGGLRAAMYHFYYPHRTFAGLAPQHPIVPTDAMQEQALFWITRLIERPGSVLAHFVPNRPPAHSGSLLVISSDAAKSGTPTPGMGGYTHGQAWYLPLLPRDLSGPTELPINVFEFVAIFGNFATFGGDIPSELNYRLLALTGSFTFLARHSARAPLMQLVHLHLIALPIVRRLAPVTEIAYIYGQANAMADAVNRGYFGTLSELCTQLRVALLWLPPHASAIVLLEDLRSTVDLSLRSSPPALPDLDEHQHPHDRPFGKRYRSDNTGDGPAYSPPPTPPPPVPRQRSSSCRALGSSRRTARLAACGSLPPCLHHQPCIGRLTMVRPCQTDNATHTKKAPITPTSPGRATLRRLRPLITPRESLVPRGNLPWPKRSRRTALGFASVLAIPVC